MVQGSGDEDMWSEQRWVQCYVLEWFCKCIPLDGSSVTLLGSSHLGVPFWIFFFFLQCNLTSIFWMPDKNVTDGTGGETSIKVEVKRLDYGDTTCLSLSNIKELTPEMTVLPLQAVQVSLANVSGSLQIPSFTCI